MDKLGMFVALIFMSIVGLACIKGGWANLGKDNGTAAFGMIFGSALLYGAYRAFESATVRKPIGNYRRAPLPAV